MRHPRRSALLVPAILALSGCAARTEPPTPCGPSDGTCPAGCTFYEDADCATCSPDVGLTAPVRTCSATAPCTRLLGTYALQGITEISAPSDIPGCKTRQLVAKSVMGCAYGGRGDFDDAPAGSPRSWEDADHTSRSWCEYRPDGAAKDSRRPLLLFVHGSGGTADDLYDSTSLRTKAIDHDLTGDPLRPGFILVAPQGRNLHWPTTDPEEGSKHDSYHRDAASNRDVAFYDQLIDSLVAEGIADPKRIYLTGWSNGARFAAFYGILRHEHPTRGGNRVAAVAPYSGGDPYENIAPDQSPSCKQDPYPTTTLPFLLISRNCDGIACNQEQFDFFVQGGTAMTPGNQAEGWISALTSPGQLGDPNVEWLRIGYLGATATSCLTTTGTPPATCTSEMALRNHFCWPDGISDGGGEDRELDLLDFLRAHPLP